MDLLQGLILIFSIHLLAAASPGPDFVMVTQQTLINGKRTGLLCSIGITLGLSVHILYSAFGLAAVIAHSTKILWIIKCLGGSYLIFIGLKGLRAKQAERKDIPVAVPDKKTDGTIIGMGFLCNVLNPKASIYFVSLFTVVLSPGMAPTHVAVYGVWIMMIQLFWLSLVVFVLSRPVVNVRFKRIGHWIDRTLGGIMVLLGIKVLTGRITG